MPDLRALRALRYDPLAVPDVGAVLCPPYDVISGDERQRLAARHPRNAVHVELPVAGMDDAADADAYARAGRLFAAWRHDGTLVRDRSPRVYVYEETYQSGGAKRLARGFFCRVRLEDFASSGGVRPHERTMGAPKEDRYRLLCAVEANLSPVLLIYQTADDGRTAERLLSELAAGPPDTDAVDERGARHRLWSADPDVPAAAELLELAAAVPLTIADGHHRYETALRYRDERRRLVREPDAAHEFVLGLLYDAASGGLSVLPTHRLIRGGGEPADLFARAQQLFEVEPSGDFSKITAALAEPGRIAVWTRGGGALLRPRRDALSPLLPEGASDALRWLDVAVLDAALGVLVGAPAGKLLEDGRLSYTKDGREAFEAVRDGRADAVFLLPATPIQAVLDIAAAGEVMPQKSTYFEPKAATGLLFNPVVE